MNGRRKLGVLLLLALLLLLAGVAARPAAAAPTEIEAAAWVNSGALNIRHGPGTGYGVVAVVYRGQQLALLGRNADSSWAKVRLPNGQEGWASTYYLTTNVAWSSLPVVTAPAPGVASGWVNVNAAHIRSGPGEEYPSDTVVYLNQQLILLGRTPATGWLKVQAPNGVQGWIGAGLVNTNVALTSLPVVDLGTGATAWVNTGAANVRSGPGAGYVRVAVVYQGEALGLLARTADYNWLQVRLPGGGTGWISSALVDANVALSSLPVYGGVTAVPSGRVNTGALNVRYGPGVAYNPFAVVYWGDSLPVLGRAPVGTWVQVQLATGQIGWVNSAYMVLTAPLSSLSVIW